jgi:hypothetical protein
VLVCPLSEREGALVRVRRRERPGMALAVWPRWAACVSRSKKTRRVTGAAPAGPRMRGTVDGVVLGSGVVGWLGGEATTICPPGVRRLVSSQSTGDCKQ